MKYQPHIDGLRAIAVTAVSVFVKIDVAFC